MGGTQQVVRPEDLKVVFMEVSAENMIRKLESGVKFCGKIDPAFITITHVIVPPQTGHTYYYEDEDGDLTVLDYIQKNNLTVVGTLHSHPSFPSSMSSIDCHMATSFQLIIPESVQFVYHIKCSVWADKSDSDTLGPPQFWRIFSSHKSLGFLTLFSLR